MTPEEHAQKIVQFIHDCVIASDLQWGSSKAFIAAQIREAVEEGIQQDQNRLKRNDLDEWWANESNRSVKRAKAEAYEDAATIAESYCSCIDGEHNDDECSAFELSEEIRARAKGTK